MRRIRWMAGLLLLLALCARAALAEPALEDRGIDLGGSGVHYPAVTGLEDAALEETVNAAIVAEGGVQTLLDRLTLVFSSPAGLHVSWEADDSAWKGGVLSCVLTASGALKDTRTTEEHTTVNIDLTDGHVIAREELFTDAEAAWDAAALLLEDTVAPELSAHLLYASLTPVPDKFTLCETGLTLWYPIGQLSTLQDHAGSVQLQWYELKDHLNLAPGSVPERIGAAQHLTLTTLDDVRAAVTNGSLPGIPARLGENMRELTDRWGMLTDPDLDDTGRVFALDGAPFRSVMILTDSLSDGWDTSTVQGIRSDRLNLCGLITGETDRSAWLEAFGEPEASVSFDEEAASAQLLPPGTSDYYLLEGCRLRLHADENGTLASIYLLP